MRDRDGGKEVMLWEKGRGRVRNRARLRKREERCDRETGFLWFDAD